MFRHIVREREKKADNNLCIYIYIYSAEWYHYG